MVMQRLRDDHRTTTHPSLYDCPSTASPPSLIFLTEKIKSVTSKSPQLFRIRISRPMEVFKRPDKLSRPRVAHMIIPHSQVLNQHPIDTIAHHPFFPDKIHHPTTPHTHVTRNALIFFFIAILFQKGNTK